MILRIIHIGGCCGVSITRVYGSRSIGDVFHYNKLITKNMIHTPVNKAQLVDIKTEANDDLKLMNDEFEIKVECPDTRATTPPPTHQTQIDEMYCRSFKHTRFRSPLIL